MDGERAKKLLENFIDEVADRFDLDVVLEWMQRSGFTEAEIAEIGYGYID